MPGEVEGENSQGAGGEFFAQEFDVFVTRGIVGEHGGEFVHAGVVADDEGAIGGFGEHSYSGEHLAGAGEVEAFAEGYGKVKRQSGMGLPGAGGGGAEHVLWLVGQGAQALAHAGGIGVATGA